MTNSAIVEHTQEFIRDQILSGQDAGLTLETPLLELGILDSFGLFKLVAHLNEHFGIDIKPDQIAGRDFKNLASIAGLVERQLESAPDNVQTPSLPQPDGVAVFEEPACAQVFIIFSGLGGVVLPPGIFGGAVKDVVENAPEFFRRAGFKERNIILLHDVRGRSYSDGVSDSLPTQERICEWLAAWIRQRPHIEDVYCLGVSSGGPMAMIAGDYLGARTVWVFAPRPAIGTHKRNASKNTQEELARFVQSVTGKAFGQLERGLTESDLEAIDAQVTPEMVADYYSSLLDFDRLIDPEHLDRVVQTLLRGTGPTEHRVYYVPRDACDTRVVESLKKCPRVTAIPVEPSDAPPPPWPFSRWIHPIQWVCRDHMIVDLLLDRGQFSTLFPAFRPVASVHAPA